MKSLLVGRRLVEEDVGNPLEHLAASLQRNQGVLERRACRCFRTMASISARCSLNPRVERRPVVLVANVGERREAVGQCAGREEGIRSSFEPSRSDVASLKVSCKEVFAKICLQRIVCNGIFGTWTRETEPEAARIDGGAPRRPRLGPRPTLKALSHPLRVQIFDALSIYGSASPRAAWPSASASPAAPPATTCANSRSTDSSARSRARAPSRERWWERTPGAVNIGSPDATAIRRPAVRPRS